jgi:hypothetical protein
MRNLEFARGGIDNALQQGNLDAIVAPTYSFRFFPAAVAGYPDLSIPVGLTPEGKPAGLWMYSGFLAEPTLLGLAYDLEQEINPRSQPQFLGMGAAGTTGCRNLRCAVAAGAKRKAVAVSLWDRETVQTMKSFAIVRLLNGNADDVAADFQICRVLELIQALS